ncbi:FAD:protein FMN transferase [Proteinivorax hydrogeniformans]|uniref:FAD:protein FMN transferase n=1 Tax=Proteinivorax hydrogeniformans TaxID=1826727 RepID=A0AAU8HWH4_9FIRM
MKNLRSIIIATLLLFVLVGCSSQNEELKVYNNHFFAMDTLVQITVHSEDSDKADEAFQLAREEVERLETKLSAHIEGSDVDTITKNAGIEPVEVSEETFYLLKKGVEYGEKTDGKFDITIGPLLEAYSWSNQVVPTEKEVQQATQLVDYKKLILDEDNQTAFLTEEGMTLDLGAIAKGFIVDKAAEIMMDHGIKYGTVDGGGDVYLMDKPDGTPWRIGIQHPRKQQGEFIGIVETYSNSVVTSGDYERYFMDGKTRIHHIIDPIEGLPPQNVQSVTISAPNATIADTLSTALFNYSPEEAVSFVEDFDGVEVLVVDSEGQIYKSTGMQEKVTINK